MISPPYLQPGDTIAIAATARKITKDEIAPAVKLFQSWGLRVALPDHLFDAEDQFAGDDTTRTQALQCQLDDPDTKAIICARGGYGTARIIDALDFSRFLKAPKWIVGYSDATVLHSHLHNNLEVETIHAIMPINIPSDAHEIAYPATETLRKALFGIPLTYSCPPHPLNRPGRAEGPLVGGNLSILYSLCGSPSSIDTTGKILFIEDLDEYLYHIDRMMTNLKRNRMLDRLSGLIVGQMSDMHDNTVPFGKTAEEIIFDSVKEYGFPVCFGFPAGHIGTDNRALTLGRRAALEVGTTTMLRWQTP